MRFDQAGSGRTGFTGCDDTMDVRTLCLGVLTEQDLSGYEIKQRFEEAFNHFFGAGFGSIYPALADLTRRGLVTCTSIPQEKRPDKKVYRITPLGRSILVEELMNTPPRHKVRSEFLVLLYFAHLLPPAKIDRLIEQMVGQWGEFLRKIEGCINGEAMANGETPPPGMCFVAGFGRAVISAARDYVAENRSRLTGDLDKGGASAEAAE